MTTDNTADDSNKLGISGRIAKSFFRSQLTPLLALVGLLMGVFATLITPKEEDPQIDVTFANVFIPYPGASADEVEALVASPAEQMLAEIRGVEHVYSMSRPGMAVMSVQFVVGEPRTQALVRLYNKLYSNQDWLPLNLGVLPTIVKPKGIDDVPVVTLTLTGKDANTSSYELAQVAHAIEVELKRIPGTNEIYTIGAPDRVVHVVFDPQKMAAHNVDLSNLRQALMAANYSSNSGASINQDRHVEVQAGGFLVTPEQVATLVVGLHQDQPVFLRDVADVQLQADTPESYVWLQSGPASANRDLPDNADLSAVTIAIAKKTGVNAQTIATAVTERIEQLQGTYIPDNVRVTVTRDYGKTATDKANKLIEKLFLVTLVVVALVFFTLGKREALVVGAAVLVTLAMTLFASWAFGFTINRVSLFALIFSIGILVDDAIVVVENIHRHWKEGNTSLINCIPRAVDEVGGPTILATFTVIAALLPMAFVSGLMGPYMSPIPINASAGMFISLLVAFAFTPWLMFKVMQSAKPHHANAAKENAAKESTEKESAHSTTKNESDDVLHRLFEKLLRPFLDPQKGRVRRWYLLIGILTLIALSLALVGIKWVVLKMLPFDNKSEIQVVIDMPEGVSLERSAEATRALANYLSNIPEVTDIEAYVGTASPINFNGLVRQYYLRSGSHVADLQVNLTDKDQRDRKSHEIALALRAPLQKIAAKYEANVKIVEVPPGPPVMSPLVAEVYGQNYSEQLKTAQAIRTLFQETNGVVDVDDSIEAPTKRYIIHVDRQKAALLGVSQNAIARAVETALSGEDASYLHSSWSKYPIPIRLEVSDSGKSDQNQFLQLKVRSQNGNLIALRDLVTVEETDHEQTRYHKDLLPVVYVTADGAGETDSPLYGMFDIMAKLSEQHPTMEQALTEQPENPYLPSIKWDGEWQVTYETFRDMGIAYGVGLIIIYLLVVAQFRSYITPLVIMAPIPLTIIGIMPGHALLNEQFTATSMIGMIALAGIIVRNSILLVDFINLEVERGVAFADAVIRAAAVRAKPIVLTALAAILDALFILDDPIFAGLAVSLIFGILISTLLTLVVIPVVHYASQEASLTQ